MGRPYTLRVTGEVEVIAAFRRLGLKCSDLSGVFGRIAGDVAHDAQAGAPKRSGKLAGSVRAGKAKTRATIYAGGARVPYAPVIEYGHAARGIRPQPFMRPAADTKADSSAEQIAAEIQRLIKGVGLG